jgi:hypothetical protein
MPRTTFAARADASPEPQTAHPAQCFGLRRVNPFLGVVAVVKTDKARALSIDGINWQIQILAHPPRGLWSGDGDSDKLQYFRFGIWSEANGLGRVPLNPILDLDRMLAASDELCQAVAANQAQAPFPLGPELEQWLLDADAVPLALVATTLDPDGLAEAGASDWSGGARGERAFVSATLSPSGETPANRLAHVEALERLVRDTAGRPWAAQWFRRDGDICVGLPNGAPPGLEGRNLPAASFPPLTLRTDWPDQLHAGLVQDYIAWLAPYLLTLPDLDEATRRELECSAVRHALLVDDLWHLYPQVLDPALLAQARVEAKLRRSHP